MSSSDDPYFTDQLGMTWPRDDAEAVQISGALQLALQSLTSWALTGYVGLDEDERQLWLNNVYGLLGDLLDEAAQLRAIAALLMPYAYGPAELIITEFRDLPERATT